MDRAAMSELKSWKSKPGRKPLLIRGARQVGKTWLMKEFGKMEYDRTLYVNFESSKLLKSLFKEDFEISRLITALQIETGIKVNPENTLIILDEIQEADGAITSLKYFQENAPQYHIIAAGSLLGVSLHKHSSFPVGKVEFLDIYPLSFEEFLVANGQELLLELLRSQDWRLVQSFRGKFIQLLRLYYFTGGMPEAVLSYVTKGDFQEVRTIQKQILTACENDFSKHAPSEIVPRIRMLWNSILAQLSKENKKFIYGALKPGARAKDYELALAWLADSGLVHPVKRATKPGIPLKSYEDFGVFKLYLSDIGLLGAMGDLDIRTLLDGNKIFEEFKGAMAEQYVLQQFKTVRDLVVYYWSAERSMAEIDFLIQYSGKVIPVEVKAEENLQAKSLKAFYQKFSPERAVRTSLSDLRKEEWLTNIPLFAISEITKCL